jgi:lantibiotic modifying enzyme
VLQPLATSLRAGANVCPPGMTDVIGALGLGGIVYGLVRASQCLQSDSLLDAAARAAEAITPGLIDRDEKLDVIWGAAGAALGLLALYRVTPRQWILDRVLACGRRLLDRALRRRRGCRWIWRTTNRRVHRGFAHGAAGITYALARIYAETGLHAYRRTARDGAIRMPRHSVVAQQDDGSPAAAMRHSWCQGLAGLALSCLSMSHLLDEPDLLEGVDETIGDMAAPAACGPYDHVCCGNVGVIELLVTAAQVLNRPDWLAAAQVVGQRVMERAGRRSSYAVCPVDDVFSPGYYDGLAGVGYGLMRLSDPQLASVLLWE